MKMFSEFHAKAQRSRSLDFLANGFSVGFHAEEAEFTGDREGKTCGFHAEPQRTAEAQSLRGVEAS